MEKLNALQPSIKSLILFTISVLLFACTNKSKTSRNERLAGMYKLHIIEYQDSIGNWQIQKWGKDGTGYIVYDGLGHMAVQITPKYYKDFTWLNEEESINEDKVLEKIDSMSLPELKAALTEFSSSYVYIANYSIEYTADIIQHDRISSSLPVIWGTKVKRRFSFDGDTLILQVLNGNRRLKWIKQK
jgi:hypothetical protein